MARPLFLESFYDRVRQLLRELGLDDRIKLAINEWGLDLPSEQQYSMESALYGARLMNVFERSGEIVEMSAVSDLVNGWPGGIIQAGRHRVFVSPIYLVNQLYAQHRGDARLMTKVESPTFNTSHEGTNVPYLDVTTSQTADGKSIFIKAVNTSPTSALLTTITIQGVIPTPRAEVKTVTAPSLSIANDFSRPDAVSIQNRMVPSGRSFVVTLPKHSVSIIVCSARP
jgi:alpha-L-arabinofuranosidase